MFRIHPVIRFVLVSRTQYNRQCTCPLLSFICLLVSLFVRAPQVEVAAWADRCARLCARVRGPVYVMWATDWEDQPVLNAEALRRVLAPTNLFRQWRPVARAQTESFRAFFTKGPPTVKAKPTVSDASSVGDGPVAVVDAGTVEVHAAGAGPVSATVDSGDVAIEEDDVEAVIVENLPVPGVAHPVIVETGVVGDPVPIAVDALVADVIAPAVPSPTVLRDTLPISARPQQSRDVAVIDCCSEEEEEEVVVVSSSPAPPVASPPIPHSNKRHKPSPSTGRTLLSFFQKTSKP